MTDKFFNAYLTTALWSSTDDSDENTGGDPLEDNYSISDIDEHSLAFMRAECEVFYSVNDTLFVENDDARAGHDFWLTRNRHGAGFWDGDWPENGDLLTTRSRLFGECNLYVGDDEKIHCYEYPGRAWSMYRGYMVWSYGGRGSGFFTRATNGLLSMQSATYTSMAESVMEIHHRIDTEVSNA